jgi:hypothetical protein
MSIKIVCTHHENHYTFGLACAATYANVEFIFWNPTIKPTYDMFYETKPDILLIQKDEVVDGLDYYMKENLSTIVHELDNNYGINLIHLKDSEPVEMPASPYVYISDHELDEQSLGTLQEFCGKYKVLIIGEHRIDLPEYVGRVNILEKYAAIRNCGHLLDSGLKYFCESQYLNKPYIDLKIGDMTEPDVSQQTYFHRLSQILLKYNFQEDSDLVLKSLGGLQNA